MCNFWTEKLLCNVNLLIRQNFSTPRKFYPFSILFEIQILSKIEANCSKQTGKKDNSKDKKADCRQSGFADVLSLRKQELQSNSFPQSEIRVANRWSDSYVVPKTTLCERKANPRRCEAIASPFNADNQARIKRIIFLKSWEVACI